MSSVPRKEISSIGISRVEQGEKHSGAGLVPVKYTSYVAVRE